VVGGARSREGTLLVDGFYNLDEGFTMPKQRQSQDTIQEFQLVNFGGAAEFGRAIGGTINAVTKSGGNVFSGTGYGFFRSKGMNAQAFEEINAGLPKSDYDREQWGGSFGGPIRQDKTFFFGSFERLNENKPYANGITPANGAAIGLPAADIGVVPRYQTSWFYFGKVDHNLNNAQRIQLSYSYTNAFDHQFSFANPLATRSYTQELPFIDYAVVGNWTAVSRGSRMFHELKASYFPRDYHSQGMQAGGPPLVADGQINSPVDLSNSSPPTVRISSVANFGSATTQNHIRTYPVQAIYTSSLFQNRHTIKFGADYMYAYYDYNQYNPLRGLYTFSSLSNYLKGVYSQYTQSFGAIANPRTHQYISGFIQDSWQQSKRFTLNYGLRYDLELNPKQEASGVPFGNDYNNLGPRAAVSYDLTDKGRTYLKLNSGMYYDRLWNNYTNNLYSLKDHETRASYTWTPATSGAPIYPAVFATPPPNLPAAAHNVILMPSDVQVPDSWQTVATLEQSVNPNIAISTSVVYSKSWHKDRTLDQNLVWNGAAYVRPDPNYRQIQQLVFDAPADYVGGIVDLNVRSARYGFTSNLTVQRSRQVQEGAPNEPRLGVMNDFGPVPDVPTVRGVMSGWFNIRPTIQVSANFTARTGLAVNPVAAGLDLNGDGVTGDRPVGLGPFSFRAPGSGGLDARLTWLVPIQNRQKLNLYVECFNVTNAERVLAVDNNYGANPILPLATFMRPLTYYPPREVQLGARLVF
jgi:hypothetical protein